jgi:hypothetical protein
LDLREEVEGKNAEEKRAAEYLAEVRVWERKSEQFCCVGIVGWPRNWIRYRNPENELSIVIDKI